MPDEIEPHWKSVISEAVCVPGEVPFDWLEFLSDPSLPFDERLDRWDAYALQFPQVELPLEHLFTEGLYARKILMPAGTIVTSLTHKEDHPFTVLRGRVSVVSETEGPVVYTAPHLGVTPAGTRRALFIHEDTEWVTFHRNPENKNNPEELVNDLTVARENRFLLKEVA